MTNNFGFIDDHNNHKPPYFVVRCALCTFITAEYHYEKAERDFIKHLAVVHRTKAGVRRKADGTLERL